MNYSKLSLELHHKKKGKWEIQSRMSLKNKKDLSLAYTPGVAAPCLAIAQNPEAAYDLTMKGRTVAVVTDGTAVLGLGNIGPIAALPVMEGKCVLYKRFAGLDAVPICLNPGTVDEIVETVKRLAPAYGAIQLEDIAAPECFEIQERLCRELDIPVMQDDQKGTATVVLAALINACKVVGKKFDEIKVVISGAGAAGIAVANLLLDAGVVHLAVADSQGVLCDDGTRNQYKVSLAKRINPANACISLKEALVASDVFIGVSTKNILNANDVRTMAKDPIVFALANPEPEIMPDEAKKGGAAIIATGRSDFPNQVNNVLAYPGLFLGVLEARLPKFERSMYIRAAHALAGLVKKPTAHKILPSVFEKKVARVVANAVKQQQSPLTC